MDASFANPFVGSWAYRSFRNLPTYRFDACQSCDDLRPIIFGEADLLVVDAVPGAFRGRLIFQPGVEMALTGASSFGNPFAVRFQGRGISQGIEDFVYDYVGYLVPVWPNGVGQRPAIVGSIVRTGPHSGGAEPGEVASWIAVKQD